jgi:hypothetical protein
MAFNPIDDDLIDYGLINSSELFTAIADNLNYLIDSMPVGSVVPILIGLTGVPTPDPSVWQLCNGSMVTNPASPLRGSTTPDYATVGRYMRTFTTVGEIGNYGGSNTKDLTHNHDGQTGLQAGDDQSDTDNDHFTMADHRHTVSSDLTTAVNFEPSHIRVSHYIKIT